MEFLGGVFGFFRDVDYLAPEGEHVVGYFGRVVDEEVEVHEEWKMLLWKGLLL